MATENPKAPEIHGDSTGMRIEITGKVKPNPTIIEGFPGIGFVSTISVEYLADHLKTKQIGRIWSDSLAPLAMLHNRSWTQ